MTFSLQTLRSHLSSSSLPPGRTYKQEERCPGKPRKSPEAARTREGHPYPPDGFSMGRHYRGAALQAVRLLSTRDEGKGAAKETETHFWTEMSHRRKSWGGGGEDLVTNSFSTPINCDVCKMVTKNTYDASRGTLTLSTGFFFQTSLPLPQFSGEKRKIRLTPGTGQLSG